MTAASSLQASGIEKAVGIMVLLRSPTMGPDSLGLPSHEPSQPAPLPKRRRLRLAIRLRTVLVVVLLAAVWAAGRVNRVRTIRRAVATIEEVHGDVLFDSPLEDAGEWKSRLHPPRWLYDALGREYFSDVATVRLHAVFVHALDPEVLRAVAALPGLKRVELHRTERDADLEEISSLSGIEEIYVSRRTYTSGVEIGGHGKDEIWHENREGRELTVAGLRSLARMRTLRKIDIRDAHSIDAAGLMALSTLRDLRSLRIAIPNREAEVLALGQFPRLQELDVWGFGRNSDLETAPRLPIESWGELRSLSIVGFYLSPDDIRAICRLPKLETLRLFLVAMNQGDYLLLREARGLKHLGLHPRECSSATVNSLKAALPGLVVESPWPHP